MSEVTQILCAIERGEPQAPDELLPLVYANTLYASSDAGLTILNFFDPNRPLQFYPPFLSATNMALSWTGGPGIKLQKTTGLANPIWQDVPDSEGVSQMQLPRTEPAAFFRLIKP